MRLLIVGLARLGVTISGTAAEVTPVSEVGPYTFTVGEIAKTLMEDYSAEVQPKAQPARRQAATATG